MARISSIACTSAVQLIIHVECVLQGYGNCVHVHVEVTSCVYRHLSARGTYWLSTIHNVYLERGTTLYAGLVVTTRTQSHSLCF